LLADVDGDQLSTLQEYAFNSNPLLSSTPVPLTTESGIDLSDQDRFIDYTFRRWQDLDASDVIYVIEASDDLNSWDTKGYDLQFIGAAIPNGDGTETVTARIKLDTLEKRTFVRLKLVQK
jgi:hypothetical protein